MVVLRNADYFTGEEAVIKARFSISIDQEVVRRVDQERRYRGEDGGEQSRSAVIQEALEMWLEAQENEDFERMTRLSDRIEATQDLISQSTERLAKMVYQANLKSEMSFQLLHDVNQDGARENVRGSAAKVLATERRQS